MTGALCLPAASVAKADVASTTELHETVLARLSHELRTPLNSVIGFSRVLQGNRKGNQQPADIAMLDAIRVSGERLLSLVEDLVALSVTAQLADVVAPAPVDVGDIAHQAMERWQPLASKKGLALVLEGPDHEAWRVDPTVLRRLLDKLVGNAVKFTGSGGVMIRIESASPEQGIASRITVSDTGIGIPSDRLQSIFEPFVQVDGSYSRAHEGAGLGLPVARALATQIGCDLLVASEPGVGTRIVVENPT